jgi:hypothetical protein
MALELLGVSAATIGLFAGFGLVIGILFGFFGMGGSFLVTPALLVLGYDSKVAVGSGLAFVFGTSVIAALRHRDLGQVDYKLGALFVVGMTAGIEVGKRFVFYLDRLGFADAVVSVAYVVLLATVGLLTLRDGTAGDSGGGENEPLDAVQRFDLPPTVTLAGGTELSVWVILALAAGIGVLSGLLGVGGGFLLMPAMMYVLGVPAAVAVGTDVFQITASGAVGSFLYAQAGMVDLSVVAPLLAGSALGARLGSAATAVVDEDDITGYFGLMLVGGAVAVAARNVGNALDVGILNDLSFLLIVGSAVLVAGAVTVSAVAGVRQSPVGQSTGSGTD